MQKTQPRKLTEKEKVKIRSYYLLKINGYKVKDVAAMLNVNKTSVYCSIAQLFNQSKRIQKKIEELVGEKLFPIKEGENERNC